MLQCTAEATIASKMKRSPRFRIGRLQYTLGGLRVELWEDKRERFFSKDNYRCKRCNREVPGRLSLHHIIPRDMYGTDDDSNLITLCVPCHDWVELNQVLDPYLRTRVGVMNSVPTVQYRVVQNILFRPQVGDKLPGDKIDIWERWVKQGRKGAKELFEKYGEKSPPPKEEPQAKTDKLDAYKMPEEQRHKLFKSAESNPLLKSVLEEELGKQFS